MKYCKVISGACSDCQPGPCNYRCEYITPPEKAYILDLAVSKFSLENRVDKAIEEMSELTKALLKMRIPGEASREAVLEEIVDAQIMLDQLKRVYNYDENIEQQKLTRLKGLLEGV